MKSTQLTIYIWLFLILTFGYGLRSYQITNPYIVDAHSWRQSDTASLAQSYLSYDFNLLYPRISRYPCAHVGKPHGLFNGEFPIISWVAIIPLKLLGYEHPPPVYLRFIVLLFFIASVIYFFLLAKLLKQNDTQALLSTLAFCILPGTIFFTRTYQPDGPAVCFIIAFFYYLLKWLRSGALKYCIISSVVGATLVLIKVSNAYVVFPALFLIHHYVGIWKAAKNYRYWLWGFGIIIPICLWQMHIASFAWNFRLGAQFTKWEMLFRQHMWLSFWYRLTHQLLGWSAIAVLLLAMHRRREPWNGFIYSWLGATIFFMLLTLPAQIPHVYYQMCILAPCAFLIGPMLYILAKKSWASRLTLVVLAFVHVIVVKENVYHRSGLYKNKTYAVEAIKLLKRHVPKGHFIVSSTKRPELYYNSEIRGWYHAYYASSLFRCVERTKIPYLLLSNRFMGRNQMSHGSRLLKDFKLLGSTGRYHLYRHKKYQSKKTRAKSRTQ